MQILRLHGENQGREQKAGLRRVFLSILLGEIKQGFLEDGGAVCLQGQERIQ